MYGHVARYVTRTRIGSDLYAWCTTLCRAGHYENPAAVHLRGARVCFYRDANVHLRQGLHKNSMIIARFGLLVLLIPFVSLKERRSQFLCEDITI